MMMIGRPLQHTPEHFLEVKLESYNTRFFHIKEDFAYTEVSLHGPRACPVHTLELPGDVTVRHGWDCLLLTLWLVLELRVRASIQGLGFILTFHSLLTEDETAMI